MRFMLARKPSVLSGMPMIALYNRHPDRRRMGRSSSTDRMVATGAGAERLRSRGPAETIPHRNQLESVIACAS
jgi:hypothetical protein